MRLDGATVICTMPALFVRPFGSFPSERDRGFESGLLHRRVSEYLSAMPLQRPCRSPQSLQFSAPPGLASHSPESPSRAAGARKPGSGERQRLTHPSPRPGAERCCGWRLNAGANSRAAAAKRPPRRGDDQPPDQGARGARPSVSRPRPARLRPAEPGWRQHQPRNRQ